MKTKRRISWANRILALVVLTTLAILAVGAYLILPAYMNPESRSYTSTLGFLKIERLLGIPMKAQAEHPVPHDFEKQILGEGTLQSSFVNVPVVPVARIKTLCVEEGDVVRKGQLLAQLDDTDAKFKLSAARSAVDTAKAQLGRAKVASPSTQVAERPEKDKTDIEYLKRIVDQSRSQLEMYRKLERDGASSKVQLSQTQVALANAELNYNQARLSLGISSQGSPQSIQIAEETLHDAEDALRQTEIDNQYYEIVAPADGIVDRVLVRGGEFNQSAGNTGIILASGLWFEANFDQQAVGDVREGLPATVNLESYPGKSIPAVVERVIPIVSFDAGGPETKSPVRPLGTGTPEWPATFRVRFQLDAGNLHLAPGLTGFARVNVSHGNSLALPVQAISSLSGGKGVVHVVNEQGRTVSTLVTIGEVDDQFAEVTSGLTRDDWVLIQSARYLRDDDKIQVTRMVATGPLDSH
jgi:HlyD family secretion protein